MLNFGLLHAQGWEHILGPSGGEIVNLDADGSTLFALTKAGIYRSEDEGYTWQLLKSSLTKTRKLSHLKASKGVFYAFSDDGKLVRSTDEGNTWQNVLQKPFPINHEDEKLKVLFVKEDTVLVGSTFTIYRSVDKGETWQQTLSLANELHDDFHGIVAFKNELFAAEGRFIHRSSDGGLSWETVFGHTAKIVRHFTTTDTFLLCLYRFKLIRSTDGMRTWQEFPIDTISRYNNSSRFNWLSGWGNELYFFSRDNFCPTYFCHSSDGGETWRLKLGERTARRLKSMLKDLVLFNRHFVAVGDGIFHSLDSAQTFKVAQEGMPILDINKVVRLDKELVINTWNSTYLSEDEGETWMESPKTRSEWDCSTHWQLMSTQSTLVLHGKMHFEDEIDCSNDRGRTWKTIEIDKNRRLTTTDHAVWLALHDKKLAQGGGYNYTYHLGKLQDGDSVFVFKMIQDYQPVESIWRFYGFNDHLVVYDSERYIIFNEAAEFVRELPRSPCDTLFPSFPNMYFDGSNYYHFCSYRTFILKPEASDWQEIYLQDWTTGTPLYHSPMTFFKSHNGITWVGLEGKGVFYATSDNGRFYPIQPQLPYPYPTDIAFEDNKIWVSTDGAGVYTMELAPIHLEAGRKPVFQVFPNPSSGELQLKSDVFFTGETLLEVLDAAGRLMGTKTLAPGLTWDVEFPGLPRGMYFLKLKTPRGTVGAKWVVH